jgi:ankyrin repeat protein
VWSVAWWCLVLAFPGLVREAWAQPESVKAEMEWRGRPEWDALEEAYESRDEGRILELMQAQPELGRAFHPHFMTAMGWAAVNGATNLLATLIREGAVEREKRSSRSPMESSLGAASEGGASWAVRMLLEAGADPNGSEFHPGPPFASPLFRVVQTWGINGSVIYNRGRELPAPSFEEKSEVLRLLFGAGANLFLGNSGGTSMHLLHYLPSMEPGLAELLLTNAIPARQTNATGDTLLHLAAWTGATNAIDVLASRGMDVRATNQAGLTPLHWLAEMGPPSAGGISGPVKYAPEWSTWTCQAPYDDRSRAPAVERLLLAGARHDVFTAAGLGATNVLAALLSDSPSSLGARDARGRTPLHWAALADQVASVEFLVQRGADLGSADQDGNTPLHLALVRWPSAAVQTLLTLKAPLERTNAMGLTPLAMAAYSEGAITALLGAGAAVNPVAGEPPLFRAMQPALTMAIQRRFVPPMMLQRGSSFPTAFLSPNELGPVKRLLEGGAKSEVGNAEGKSPLEVACDAGALNLVELLVRHGARLNGTNVQGGPVWFGVLRHAASLPYADTATWKHQMAEAMPSVVKGAMSRAGVMPTPPGVRMVSVLEFLSKLGAKLAATNAMGQNALHVLAARSEAARAWGGMMMLGPDGRPSGMPAGGGGTPATQRVTLLMEAGLSLESRDREGNTPWLLTWRSMDVELATHLAKAGANVRATNAAGMNALHLICLPPEGTATGQPRFVGPLVPQLVRQGVDPRARDRQGATPLHYAIGPHNPPFVAVELVEAGADPGAKDSFGVSPIDLAKEANRQDLLPFLRDPLGANPFRQPLPQNLPQ